MKLGGAAKERRGMAKTERMSAKKKVRVMKFVGATGTTVEVPRGMLRVEEGRSTRFKRGSLRVKEALWGCLTAGHFQSDAPHPAASLSRRISRSAGFVENALKCYAKWMGEEDRFQGCLKGAKSPSSAPDGVGFLSGHHQSIERAFPGPKWCPGSAVLRGLCKSGLNTSPGLLPKEED